MTITLKPATVALNDRFRKGDSSLGLWVYGSKGCLSTARSKARTG